MPSTERERICETIVVTMAQDNPYIVTLFNLLDEWRHLPAYQLERRADIFFALYLREVVEHEAGVLLDECVVPELPIKQPDSNLSCKADYLLTSRDRSTVFLVELKTDVRSRRVTQDAYLERARAEGFAQVVQGLKEILLATSQQQKYFRLIKSFERLGFWTLPTDLQEYMFPELRRGLTERLRRIELAAQQPAVRVLYIEPLSNGDAQSIDFACFARHVIVHKDPLSQRFAESLMRWRDPAGPLAK